MDIRNLLHSFVPNESTTPWSEKLLSAFLVFISISLIVWFTQIAQFYDINHSLLLLVSIGASAILVFAVPHGKLSQPWPVIGSHVIAATIGITCAKYLPNLVIASGISVFVSTLIMYFLRCLHPPGGGTALTVVFASPVISELGYGFVINPVLIDSLLLVVLGVVLNNLIPNRYYPYTLKPQHKEKQKSDTSPTLLTQGDISQALEKMGIYVDITKSELSHIYAIASDIAQQRKLEILTCQDIMSQPVLSVEYGDDLETVWKLLSENKIKALPIIDKREQVQGIVTIADILNQLDADSKQKLSDKFKKFIKKTDDVSTDKLEYAGHLMTKNVITLNQHQPLDDVLKIFFQSNKRHFPVVDDNKKLVGMITSRNIIEALNFELK
ncbi:MAG: HPP family protein [Gammaproteobacteria bacterium]|nr:HPP family protein [Gammaproteobacteria bacterium]